MNGGLLARLFPSRVTLQRPAAVTLTAHPPPSRASYGRAREFQNTMADRLREIECPTEVRHSIDGWVAKKLRDTEGVQPPQQVRVAT